MLLCQIGANLHSFIQQNNNKATQYKYPTTNKNSTQPMAKPPNLQQLESKTRG